MSPKTQVKYEPGGGGIGGKAIGTDTLPPNEPRKPNAPKRQRFGCSGSFGFWFLLLLLILWFFLGGS